MKPLTYDRGYDNVLLGQGYRTPRGAVIDEYGAVVEWWLAGETDELGEKPTTDHFIYLSLEITRDWTRIMKHLK
jgi:hypothetical protein